MDLFNKNSEVNTKGISSCIDKKAASNLMLKLQRKCYLLKF